MIQSEEYSSLHAEWSNTICLFFVTYAGNRVIHNISSSEPHELRVELEDFQGSRAYAFYSNFSIGPESDGFKLAVSGYSGNAGEKSV